jgi:hypothetical protein
MTAPEVSATDVYALGRDPAESARLRRQSEELRPDSAALLDRVGLGPGQSAIDIGCGPSGIDDPRRLVLPHLTFLVWGRKPDLTR